ncbi:MAG: glycosyltransferase family 1 protein [Candidatus Moraniibacteriota bacterium]
MTKIEKTIAIDIRLLGKKRTGDEMVFFHLTKEVLKLDHDNRYVLLTDETDAERIAMLAGNLGCAGRQNVEIVTLAARNRFVWNLWTLPNYLFQNAIDVFHTQYILPLCSPRRTGIAVHIHDVSFRAHPALIGWTDRLFLSLLIPRSLRRAALIIAPSQFTKDEIVRYYGIDSAKITVIPNAIGEEFLESIPEDPASDRAIREKYHLPEKFIIAVGTLQPRKNIPFLINAFAALRKRLPDMGLVLVGNRDAHHTDTHIQQAIATHHLDAAVVFPGFIEQQDLPRVVRLATICAVPSLYEGFGIPMLEAMSQGVPVAAADIPSLREVGGEAALYFDPVSIASCAEKLYTLSIDQKKRQALRSAGKERLRRYSWQGSAQALLQAYDTITP